MWSGEANHLKDVVTQGVEEVVRHDANGIDTRAWPQQNSGSAELDGSIVYRIENGHVQLTGI